MASTNGIEDRYALITGGTRGIGYGIAHKLAETGHHLILGYNSNTERADKAKQELMSKYGVRVFTVGGDVAYEKTIDALFDAVKTQFNNCLNVLVHNAGLYLGLTTETSSEKAKTAQENPGFKVPAHKDNTKEKLNFNLYDYYQSVYPKCFIRCVEKALPLMKDGDGYIVAISSPGCNSLHRPLPMYDPGPGKAVLDYLVRMTDALIIAVESLAKHAID